jgi:mannose-6-phosphate isomerase-like protein (cupin superfamily)
MISPRDVAATLPELWSPRVLAGVDDAHVKVARLLGPGAWYCHEQEDVMFLVLAGRLRIEMDSGTVELAEGQLFVVPKGERHHPVAERECLLLLVDRMSTGQGGDPATAGHSIVEQARGSGARAVVASIQIEFRRYKSYAERTFDQLSAEQLNHVPGPEGNSVATLVWHISGNLRSRFTDFLTTDGEKPWRQRDTEFEERHVGPEQLRQKWAAGWAVLFATLEELSDDDLGRRVSIRGEDLAVHAALHLSLAHTSSHVGQIVMLGKTLLGTAWRTLTIPRPR